MPLLVDSASELLAEGGVAPPHLISTAHGHAFYRTWYGDRTRWIATPQDEITITLVKTNPDAIVGPYPDTLAHIRWNKAGRATKDTRFVRTLTAAELPAGRYEWRMYVCATADNVPFWMETRVMGGATTRTELSLKKSDNTTAPWQRAVVQFMVGEQGAALEFGATLSGSRFVYLDQPLLAIMPPDLTEMLAGFKAQLEWLNFMNDNHIEIRPFVVDFGDVTPGTVAEAKVTIRQARRADKLLGDISGHLDYTIPVALDVRGARPEITSDFSDRDDAAKWLDLAAGAAQEITLRLTWVDWISEIRMVPGVVMGQLSIAGKTRTHGIIDQLHAPIMLKATVKP